MSQNNFVHAQLPCVLSIIAVMTEHIVDVRVGQTSDGFDRYPYEEMEGQSLSILVEREKIGSL